MPTADGSVGDGEANALFRGLEDLPGLVLAVSGGPDSTALLVLAARWAKRLKRAPKLIAVTIDHGLRPEAAREAAMVKELARRLGVPHRTLRWRGRKPRTGLQEAARYARYALLAQVAMRARFAHILTAHTLDDQAETVLFRLARGSGLFGLAGMAHAAPLPLNGMREIFLVRPLLASSQGAARRDLEGCAHRLCRRSEQPRSAFYPRAAAYADAGAGARRPRRARPGAACGAAAARRIDHPGRRAGRARGARAAAVAAAWTDRVRDRARSRDLPAEVGLRLLGEAVAHTGDEGPVELAKLESLYEALRQARSRLRRTLAGALITLDQ